MFPAFSPPAALKQPCTIHEWLTSSRMSFSIPSSVVNLPPRTAIPSSNSNSGISTLHVSDCEMRDLNQGSLGKAKQSSFAKLISSMKVWGQSQLSRFSDSPVKASLTPIHVNHRNGTELIKGHWVTALSCQVSSSGTRDKSTFRHCRQITAQLFYGLPSESACPTKD